MGNIIDWIFPHEGSKKNYTQRNSKYLKWMKEKERMTIGRERFGIWLRYISNSLRLCRANTTVEGRETFSFMSWRDEGGRAQGNNPCGIGGCAGNSTRVARVSSPCNLISVTLLGLCNQSRTNWSTPSWFHSSAPFSSILSLSVFFSIFLSWSYYKSKNLT